MKSIIFNQHQVNHALKNEKGMFRVVVKPQPEYQLSVVVNNKSDAMVNSVDFPKKIFLEAKPKFQAGETIFVKESWNKDQGVIYKADSLEANVEWISANYMSKWASRLTLRIKSVKVERLQDISEEGCWKEGFLTDANYSPFRYFEKLKKKTAEQKFISHWNSTHKKPEEKWEANPFVFCFSYEVVR